MQQTTAMQQSPHRVGSAAASVASLILAAAASAQPCAAPGRWLTSDGSPSTSVSSQDSYFYAATAWDPDGAGPQPERLVVVEPSTVFRRNLNLQSNIGLWNGRAWVAAGAEGTPGGAGPWVQASWSYGGAGVNPHTGGLIISRRSGSITGFSGAAPGIFEWTGATTLPASNGWITRGQTLPAPASQWILDWTKDVTVWDGRLVAVGPCNWPNNGCNGVLIYDPVLDSWSTLGNPTPTHQTLFAATEWNGDLFVGGYMTEGNLKRYVPATGAYVPVDTTGLLLSDIYGLTVWRGTLVASGPSTTTHGTGVYRWDAALGRWLPMPGARGSIGEVVTIGDELYAVGNMHLTTIPLLDYTPRRVVRWDDAAGAFVQMGRGITGHVAAVARHNGRVYVGGGFRRGDRGVLNIAEFDGDGFEPAGVLHPVPGASPTTTTVYDLVSTPQGLVAVGNFAAAEDGARFNVRRRDDATGEWSPIGDATGITTRAVLHDGELYINYTHQDLRVTVARFDGGTNTFIPAPHGMFNSGSSNIPSISALCSFGDRLVIGGAFVQVSPLPPGAPGAEEQALAVSHIATWSPTAGWGRLQGSTGFSIGPRTLHVHDGVLYAGGAFTSVDGQPANGLARWTGAAWVPVGNLASLNAVSPATVNDLSSHRGRLVIAGNFRLPPAAGGAAVITRLAALEGAVCRPLGTVSSASNILELSEFGDRLLAVGNFTHLSTFAEPTGPVAQWHEVTADIGSVGGVLGGDGVLDNNDFVVFVEQFFAAAPLADIARTGGIEGPDGRQDSNDFIVFIDRFFSGC